MPSRYWLPYLAARGCLIGFLLAPSHVVAQTPPQPEKPPAETQAQSQPTIVIDTSVFRAIFDDAVQIYRNEKEAAEPREERSNARDEADLIAQQDMAKWAFGMLIATIFGIGINVATLVFLKKTFDANKKTADAAVKAADATVAAERARFIVEIQSVGLDGALRAAALHDRDPNTVLSGKLTVNFRFRNFGKTPGIPLEIGIAILVSADPPEPVYEAILREEIGTAYGAGDQTNFITYKNSEGPKSIGDAKKILNGEEYVWIAGRLLYSEIFGDQRKGEHIKTHRFFYRMLVQRNGQDFFFQPYDHKHYNQST